MNQPPAPYDEEKVGSTDIVIRRIMPEQHVVFDANKNCMRLSSKLYSPSTGVNEGMSVDLEELIKKAGKAPVDFVTSPKFTGSVKFIASAIRGIGFWIGYDPIPENDHHGQVWGEKIHSKFTRTQKKELQAQAVWYVQIKDVELL